jgi:hypothetical protein
VGACRGAARYPRAGVVAVLPPYYGGSSLFGAGAGWVFADVGRDAFVSVVIAMCVVAGVLAAGVLRRRG